jgi:WD40 repeat protein
VVTTTEDGRLEVCAANSLEPRRELGRDGSHFVSVAASRLEAWAVAGDRNGGLTFWDLEQGTELRTVKVHTGVVECVKIAGDGRSFASADAGGKVLFWPGRTAEPVPIDALDQRVVSLAFDGKGQRIAIGTDQGRLHCTSTDGRLLLELRVAQDQLFALSFAPGDRELWVGARAIHIVDLESGKVARTISSRNGTCRELIHDVDGSVLSGGWWRIDRYVDGQRAEPLSLTGAWKMDLDPAARRLVAQQRHSLDLIDIAQHDLRRLDGTGALALSGDGKTAVTFVRGALSCIDVATGVTTTRFRVPHTGWLQLDGDGGRAAVIGPGDVGVTVMDTKTHEPVFHVEGAIDTPFNESAAFRPGVAELAVVVGHDRIRRHDAATGAVLGEFEIPGTRIMRVRYSQDGSKLAAIWRNGRTVRVFDLAAGTFADVTFDLQIPDGLNPTLASVALDRDGRRVAVGTWAGQVAVHDTADQQVRSYQSHSGTTWSLAFSPSDAGLLISSTGAGGITFWDLDSGEACYQTWRLEAPLSQMQISDDGRTLACYANTGPVLVDLEYRERHAAGILEHSLRSFRDRMVIPPRREAELRAWATAVLARSWPRWQ